METPPSSDMVMLLMIEDLRLALVSGIEKNHFWSRPSLRWSWHRHKRTRRKKGSRLLPGPSAFCTVS
jgi:hypothetical protein